MSKRAFQIATLAALLAAPIALAQPPAAVNVVITPQNLGNRTWMLVGQGGNITVIAGDDGIIMVDSQFGPMHGAIKTAIGKVSDKPVRYVVNTHLHGDHTGGNSAFWLDGATIVGTENLRKSMAEGTANALTNAKTPPALQSALPTRTYRGQTTLSVKGRTVRLVAMPTAHTRGDTAVWVPDADVLATGDIVSIGNRYPNIDVGDGGDIDGMVRAVEAYIARATDKTKVVPGHGPLMSKKDLQTYLKLLVDARAAVAKAKASGMTEDQVVAAKPLAGDIQGRAGANDQASVNFVRLIYRSVG